MNTDYLIQQIEELSRKTDSVLDTLKRTLKNNSEWLDKEETMRILKCSERTLQTLRDKKKLGFSRPLGGTKFFYRRSDVMALFEKNFDS